MKVLILLSFFVAFAQANENDTTTTTTTASPSEATTPESSSGAPPSARIPRGTVYQIRPVNFRVNGDNPFAHIEAVSDFKFPNLKAISDSVAEASETYGKNNEDDSAAEEAIDIPKFIEALASSEEEDSSAGVGSPSPSPQPSQRRQGEKRKKNVDGVPKDASYAFGYTLEDQTRHEIADPTGNVNGYYQYIDDEGYVRKVVYTAGPGKGFVVLNKERVKGPVGVGGSIGGNKKKASKNQSSGDNSPAPSTSNNVTPPGYPGGEEENREDTEESTYPGQPQPPFWVQDSRTRDSNRGKSARKPIYIVKIRRPQQSQGVKYLTHYKDDGLGHYIYEGDNRPLRIEKVAVLQMPIPLPVDFAPATIYTTPHYHRKRQRSSRPTFISRDESPLVFLAGSGDEDDGSYREEYQYQGSGSSEDNGQWDGNIGDSGSSSNSNSGGNSNSNNGKAKPDGSYSFGYETETANRLEKADGNGNVRGSYSYIDSNGIKRTVHYVAGASTGFQVLGTSPSAARSVRIEAPPGFIVSRRPSPRSNNIALATSEFRYPAQPSAVIYHIHPDSGWKPWETSAGGRKPRKMRKVMRIHRKKPRTYPKDIELLSSPKISEFSQQQNEGQSQGTFVVQSHPEEQRPFRHSTRVHNNSFRGEGSPEVVALGDRVSNTEAFFERRRRPSHRAYTDVTTSEETDDTRNDPVLFSPNYEALSESRNNRRPIPNPIVLQPSAVFVKNRGSNSISPYEVAESMVYSRRSNGGPLPTVEALEPSESIHSLSNASKDFSVSTSSSSVSSTSTTISQGEGELIPVAIVTDSPKKEEPTTLGSVVATQGFTERTSTLDFPSSTTTELPLRAVSSSTLLTTIRSTRRRGQGQGQRVEPKTASPTIVRMTREEITKNSNTNNNSNLKNEEREDGNGGGGTGTTMTSSTRLMQRLSSSGAEAAKGN